MVDFKHRNVFLTIAMFSLNHNNVFFYDYNRKGIGLMNLMEGF